MYSVKSRDNALKVIGVSKSYPGVQALAGVEVSVGAGEIVALAGANGAGKSTLVKILSGSEQPDSGKIFVDGVEVQLNSPHAARLAGIYTIHQEMSLVPHMTVAENIFLDDFVGTSLVRSRELEMKAKGILARLGVDFDVRTPVGQLPLAQQQLVEIAKAVKSKPRVLLLDEPTTTLPPKDVASLLNLMRALAKSGVGLIFVSHRMDEVTAVCDAVEVLRDGERVRRFDSVPVHHEIVREMVGEKYENSLIAATSEGSAESSSSSRLGGISGPNIALKVDGITDGARVQSTTFTLHEGEILGITGLLGSGQAELAECLFGMRHLTSGRCLINGRQVRLNSPRHAIRAGIGFLPEDRKSQGLVLDMSVQKNITLASMKRFSRIGLLQARREQQYARAQVEELQIKCSNVNQVIGTMSGGNQQKVLFSRWLTRNSKILILSEPTRGVDVAAKEEIYRLIREYLRAGGSAILISSELSEAALCDRVLVMAAGHVVAEASHEDIQKDRDQILSHLR